MDDNENELRRLGTLQLYNILDTAAEKAFDDLTRLAAAICDVPISLVSFVDGRRQRFKARTGLDICETPKEQAFCALANLSDEIMVVEDARIDTRFADNPLVKGDPHIRFYAGVPLKMSNNARSGTLCVIDTMPRKLSDAQARALSILRDAVVTQLEFRRATSDLRTLGSMMQMCAWCRSVRTIDEGQEKWEPLQHYVEKREQVTLVMCPICRDEITLE